MHLTCKKNNWEEKEISNENDVKNFIELEEEKTWIFRGQRRFGTLFAPIDRPPLNMLTRAAKLAYENECITKIIESVKYPSDDIEKELLAFDPKNIRLLKDRRIPILMILQHYNCPTRLLDWSIDPCVALFFAVTNNYGKYDNEDGEIWCFNYHAYNDVYGPQQWELNPEVYTKLRKFDDRLPSLFSSDEPSGEWIAMQALDKKFHRLHRQSGFFSVSSHFGVDHAIAIQKMFCSHNQYYRKYIIPKKFKPALREYLIKKQGTWFGTLFPDISGVAHGLRNDVFKLDN